MKEDASAVKDAVQSHYDSSATTYHRRHYREFDEYSPLRVRQAYVEDMLEAAQPGAGARVLDVGCGPGELVVSLAEKGYASWGIDISSSMVARAREVVGEAGLPPERISLGDFEDLAFPDASFDAVVAAGVIEYQKSDAASLREAHRVLADGGVLILNVTVKGSLLNALDGPYRWLRRNSATRSALDWFKSRILGRGGLNEFPESRSHRPRAFDTKLRRHGFQVTERRFFHFSPLPSPLNVVFPRFSKTLGRRMEALAQRRIARWLAGGYLVTARKST